MTESQPVLPSNFAENPVTSPSATKIQPTSVDVENNQPAVVAPEASLQDRDVEPAIVKEEISDATVVSSKNKIILGVIVALLVLVVIVVVVISNSSSPPPPTSAPSTEIVFPEFPPTLEPEPTPEPDPFDFPEYDVGPASCAVDFSKTENQIMCTQDFSPDSSDIIGRLVEGNCTDLTLPEPSGITSSTRTAEGIALTDITFSVIPDAVDGQEISVVICLITTNVFVGLDMDYERSPIRTTFIYNGGLLGGDAPSDSTIIESDSNSSIPVLETP